MRKPGRWSNRVVCEILSHLRVYIPTVRPLLIVLLAIATAVPLGGVAWAQIDQHNDSSAEVEVDGCVDRKDGRFEITNELWWVLYSLTGQTAGLKNHIGDEVKVRGIETEPVSVSKKGRRPPTLKVTSIEFITHKNPEGVRPVLDDLNTWVKYENPLYGVRVRYPATFGLEGSGNPTSQANFAGQDGSTSVRILSVNIPGNTYPGSNFVDGVFAIFVNPNIHSEGTCSQFARIWPEHTALTNIGGVSYTRTMGDGVAAGTDYTGYDFHTFQNGLCYELTFDFAEGNGGGMDIPCAIQWVSEDNLFELMNGVLKQTSYFKPELKLASADQENVVPTITSFEHDRPFEGGIGMVTMMNISWKTQNADYVRLSYKCVDNVYVTIIQPTTPGYSIDCGEKAQDNSMPNGSVELMLGNFNHASVNVVISVEPFRAGVGYPKESRSVSVEVPPRPQVNSNSQGK
jgi:hypothetical protein